MGVFSSTLPLEASGTEALSHISWDTAGASHEGSLGTVCMSPHSPVMGGSLPSTSCGHPGKSPQAESQRFAVLASEKGWSRQDSPEGRL